MCQESHARRPESRESLNEEAGPSKEFDIQKPARYSVRAQRFDKESKAQGKSGSVTCR